ncbi:MAG: sugar porter family MFS transporter, partial [Bacteroidetes bacterium]|nr:sugar porter family MFS transporter [Bacteroidota bacterium]
MTNKGYIMLIALIVALGGFLMGFDASVISGVNEFIEPEFNLTKLELGWAVASLTLTSAPAMLVAGALSDRIGRKKLLSYAAILYAISAISSALAPSFLILVIARMVGGLGVGASLIIAPMYIAEISPPKIRGQMVSFNQLNIVLGISAAFFSNYLILKLGQSDAGWAQSLKFDEYAWRWMLGLETLPAILYFFGLFFVPKSPRWLAMKGEFEAALKIMKRASGAEKAQEILATIKESLSSGEKEDKIPIAELFKPAMRLVLVIGIVVAVLQQITGINSVFFYAPMIFKQSGIGQDASFTQAIYVGLINLAFTVLAIALIDKLGRKPLLSFGVAGIVIFMFMLAYGFYSATYTLSPESVVNLPEAINQEALVSLHNQTFDSDVDFKTALAGALGADVAGEYESDLITAAIQMNPMLILIGILG